jgi:hypothetical protein
VRALIDQNFKLKRLVGLRARDRDRWTAAETIVDGTAALASGLRASTPRGTALDDVAAGVFDTTSVLASGPGSADVAAAALVSS